MPKKCILKPKEHAGIINSLTGKTSELKHSYPLNVTVSQHLEGCHFFICTSSCCSSSTTATTTTTRNCLCHCHFRWEYIPAIILIVPAPNVTLYYWPELLVGICRAALRASICNFLAIASRPSNATLPSCSTVFTEDAHKVSSTCAYCIPRYRLASTLILLYTHNNAPQNIGGACDRGSPTKRDPISCITVTGSVREVLQHFLLCCEHHSPAPSIL